MFFDPKKINLNYEEVSFVSEDGTKLSGWFFPSPNPSKNKTLILFHGNADNISAYFYTLAWVTKHGYDFFLFDYRGFGKSEGVPSEEGTVNDSVAAVKRVLQGFDGREPKKVILYGESLGGAVVLGAFRKFPNKEKIEAVVVEGGFSSYPDIARQKLSSFWLTWPLQPLSYVLVDDLYSGSRHIKDIAPVPLLVIHGDHDPVVPFQNGETIYGLAHEPKFFWKIAGGKHIDSMFIDHEKNRDRLIHYFELLENNKNESLKAELQ